jgi:enoyl-[acyl-carrier protein] reductase II
MNRTISDLFNIQVPVIQAGMVWCSGWELASAVSNAGGLGLIGSGSMYPDILRSHIRKCREATRSPFGVNVPLLYPQIADHMQIIIDEGVKIVFTSAGNPKTWTGILKKKGITVVHVVSNVKFALKAREAGVDAIVAEGFEAGGHNGREETTTMVLVPMIKKEVGLPLIAAGGIASGAAMLAAFALGADGVQIGSRFVISAESSAHANFKQAVINASEGSTQLSLKQLTPVRLLKNKFYEEVEKAERNCATPEELRILLGKGRAKKGMFEGDLDEGELEIGQVAGTAKEIKPAALILEELILEFRAAKHELSKISM